MMKKTLTAILGVALLAGCASTSESDANLLAADRAEQLSRLMPLDIDKYKFVRAQSRDAVVLIEVLYGGGSKLAPSQMLAQSVINFCKDPSLRDVMGKGVHYAVTIRDIRGRPIAEQLVNEQACQQVAL
uniref:type II secretion system pilot lipoprotein GspS-beta n=1 Tax=Thaumasiovibrio occultus TaxID=1891184 RepID=UPI000B35F8D0|nr:type II secretion system pilot lipoprotein GspS-beta [Thaumasiovibrio occultus]